MTTFLITYESSQWCGAADTHVIVHGAMNETHAEDVASDHMESEMRELFSDEYADEDEGWEYDGCAYSVTSVEVFDESHEQWQFFQDAEQRAAFYPEIHA